MNSYKCKVAGIGVAMTFYCSYVGVNAAIVTLHDKGDSLSELISNKYVLG